MDHQQQHHGQHSIIFYGYFSIFPLNLSLHFTREPFDHQPLNLVIPLTFWICFTLVFSLHYLKMSVIHAFNVASDPEPIPSPHLGV